MLRFLVVLLVFLAPVHSSGLSRIRAEIRSMKPQIPEVYEAFQAAKQHETYIDTLYTFASEFSQSLEALAQAYASGTPAEVLDRVADILVVVTAAPSPQPEADKALASLLETMKTHEVANPHGFTKLRVSLSEILKSMASEEAVGVISALDTGLGVVKKLSRSRTIQNIVLEVGISKILGLEAKNKLQAAVLAFSKALAALPVKKLRAALKAAEIDEASWDAQAKVDEQSSQFIAAVKTFKKSSSVKKIEAQKKNLDKLKKNGDTPSDLFVHNDDLSDALNALNSIASRVDLMDDMTLKLDLVLAMRDVVNTMKLVQGGSQELKALGKALEGKIDRLSPAPYIWIIIVICSVALGAAAALYCVFVRK